MKLQKSTRSRIEWHAKREEQTEREEQTPQNKEKQVMCATSGTKDTLQKQKAARKAHDAEHKLHKKRTACGERTARCTTETYHL
ncbi:hypothetical protein HMPREF3190_01330 [Umbribacter vaginalis]|nr:hypothetical protein HMPREF3190_01330 [Coriobacteriales bacterium DNF00809]